MKAMHGLDELYPRILYPSPAAMLVDTEVLVECLAVAELKRWHLRREVLLLVGKAS